MAEDFADAFKRYWALIVSVAAACVVAGGIALSIKDEIASVRSDLRAYIVEREGLLRDINGRFDRIERRLDNLERRP